MPYSGQVKNGVVVFDGEPPLPEGSRVKIEPVDDAKGRTLADRLRPVIGIAKGLLPDLAKNHDHYLHGRAKT